MEIHVYIGNGMPVNGLVTFWEVNEAINMHKACVRTNQIHFINDKVIDMGYKLYVHKDGISERVQKGETKAVRKWAGKQYERRMRV